MDEDKKKDYRKLLCSICKNRDSCDKNKMRIRYVQDRTTIFCGFYKNERDLV